MDRFGFYGAAEPPFELRGAHVLSVGFPGAGARSAGASLVTAPSLSPAAVRMDESIPRGRDFVVRFDPTPSAPGERLAFGVEILSVDPLNGPTILCAVPSCAGAVTVPAALLARFTPGAVRVRASLRQSVPIGPSTRSPALYFQVISLVAYRGLVE